MGRFSGRGEVMILRSSFFAEGAVPFFFFLSRLKEAILLQPSLFEKKNEELNHCTM